MCATHLKMYATHLKCMQTIRNVCNLHVRVHVHVHVHLFKMYGVHSNVCTPFKMYMYRNEPLQNAFSPLKCTQPFSAHSKCIPLSPSKYIHCTCTRTLYMYNVCCMQLNQNVCGPLQCTVPGENCGKNCKKHGENA